MATACGLGIGIGIIAIEAAAAGIGELTIWLAFVAALLALHLRT